MLNPSQLRDIFVLSDEERCQIESYEVYDENRNVISIQNPLRSLMNLAGRNSLLGDIEFNSDILEQDGTVRYIDYRFQIKVTANGGATAWKNVIARIVVCGWEEISLVEDRRILYEFHYSLDPIAQIYPLSANFTSNDTDCPVINYEIKT